MADEEQEGTVTVPQEDEYAKREAALGRAVREERDARKAAEKSAKELSARLAEIEQERAADKVGVTSDRLAEIRSLAESKFKADLEERDRLKAEVRALKLDGKVGALLARAEIVDPVEGWDFFRKHFDLTDDGTPIVATDPTQDVEQYISTTLRTKYPYMFRGTQADGGSARGNRGSNSAVRTIQAGDTKSFLANLDKIASGEVEVR